MSAIESAVKAELVSRGVQPVDAEMIVLGVVAFVETLSGVALKRAAAAGAEAAARITTADEAELAARSRE